MSTGDLIRGTIVFLSAVGLDALWALYIRRSSQGKALSAASFAAVLLALGAFNAISYLENHWLLAPAMAGAFLGTFVTIRFEQRRRDHDAVERLLEETREHRLPQTVDVAELALDSELEEDGVA